MLSSCTLSSDKWFTWVISRQKVGVSDIEEENNLNSEVVED